jgi:hypothetical protein
VTGQTPARLNRSFLPYHRRSRLSGRPQAVLGLSRKMAARRESAHCRQFAWFRTSTHPHPASPCRNVASAGTSPVLTKRGNGFSRRAGRAALIAAICVRSWEPRHVPPDRIECVRWKRPIFRLRSAVSRCDALRSSGLKPKYREATDRLCP